MNTRIANCLSATIVMLKLAGKPIRQRKLLKLLYLADRTMLLSGGCTITTATPVAMENGPVLVEIYDLLRGKGEKYQEIWNRFIRVEDKMVSLIATEIPEWLSEADEDMLQNVYQHYGSMTADELSAETHELPEWHGAGKDMSWLQILTDNEMERYSEGLKMSLCCLDNDNSFADEAFA